MVSKIPIGTKFDNGHGAGYIVVQDILPPFYLKSRDFIGYGGLSRPQAGDLMPEWFVSLFTNYIYEGTP